MPVNLLAICKVNNGIEVKHIKTTGEVQDLLAGIFLQQEDNFTQGVSEETLFDGGYTPDPNELLYALHTPQIANIFARAFDNVTSLEKIKVEKFSEEGIVALSVAMSGHGYKRLLVQDFSLRQVLQKRFSLFLDGDTFSHLTAESFSIGATLAAIVTEDRVKFKQFLRVKTVFDLTDLYKEATDAELSDFCDMACLSFEDSAFFVKKADQKMKKLVHAISRKEVLGKYNASEIQTAAVGQGFSVDISGDKIVIPKDKKMAKEVLMFLDDALYRAALSGTQYQTNSKKVYGAL